MVVVPDVDSIAAVFVAPFNLGLEMRPFAVLIPFDGVIRVSSSVAEIPSIWVGNARVPDEERDVNTRSNNVIIYHLPRRSDRSALRSDEKDTYWKYLP